MCRLSATAELAPAKVNLALHVTGRRADGYHLLDSLVAFARLGDVVAAEPSGRLSLSLGGPFARDLDGGADNLVLRAAAALGPDRGAALHLTKTLPVASGVGGGSADAAATLRLLARVWDRPAPDGAAMLRLGADVPVCHTARPARMGGIGGALAPVALPPFWMVLVNPGVPLETRAVFAALAGAAGAPMADPGPLTDLGTLAAYLRAQRNDLAAAAVAVAPAARAPEAPLAAAPGCRIARMSGSGATWFGLFEAEAPALAAAERIRAAEPAWWVAAAPALHA